MPNQSNDQLKKSKTTYENLHRGLSSNFSIGNRFSLSDSEDSNEETDIYDDYDQTSLPNFVNRFFFPKTKTNTETGVFRAIRGQVIIHHDDDRSLKVQSEDIDGDRSPEPDDDELENLTSSRTNTTSYELHYDVDNPLEISCSMSLSSAETVSDCTPSPNDHRSIININGQKSIIQQAQTPIELSDNDDGVDDHDKTPSSMLSENESFNVKDPFAYSDESDDKLSTFHGWHMSMLKQIDEKLKEIEQETAHRTPTPPTPSQPPVEPPSISTPPLIKKERHTTKKLMKTSYSKKKSAKSHIRQRDRSPMIKSVNHDQHVQTPSVEKESRTLVINIPPSSSSEDDEASSIAPVPEPIHIRIIPSSTNFARIRSQSSERLGLRDQAAQTEPPNQIRRMPRPASVDIDQLQNSRSMSEVGPPQSFHRQHNFPVTNNSQTAQQIKFYSLRSRNTAPRPSVVNHTPMIRQSLPQTAPTIRRESRQQSILPTRSPDPSVFADDYGHVTQMDTTNLGSLVDRVFDDIHQDKPSDFYRDYHKLLNDIQVRFSMMTNFDQTTIAPVHHRPIVTAAPPSEPIFRSNMSSFSKFNTVTTNNSAHLCDTLIYIPNAP